MDPVVTVIVPTNRPKYWARLCYSLTINDTPYEVLFVGYGDGTETIMAEHPEFRFISTRVKPSQCTQIGILNARGKFVILGADDVIFEPHFIDDMLKTYQDAGGNAFVSCYLKYNGEPIRTMFYHGLTFRGGLDLQTTGYFELVERDTLLGIGGVDSNFLGSYYNWDIGLRLKGIGQQYLYCNTWANELVPDENTRDSMSDSIGVLDEQYITKCWSKDGAFTPMRQLPVTSFIEDKILETTQGTTIQDRWS